MPDALAINAALDNGFAILSPVAMEKKFQYLYFKTILLMRVKRHRTKEWREDAKFCCAGICLPGTFSSMFLGIRGFHWPHDVTSVWCLHSRSGTEG